MSELRTPKNEPLKSAVIAQSNSVSKQSKQPTSIKGWLGAYEAQIAKALPTQIGHERFQRICMTAITQNKLLANCTPQSFIGCVLNAAQLGLEPNTPLGQAYLIPYKNYKTGEYQCQFQIGYRGMIELARRSGEIAMIKAQTVYENDEFHYELGLDPFITHVPAVGERGKAVAYYAFYKTKSGDFDFEVATVQEIAAHRNKYSKAKNSPWNTEFDAMAKKTLIKRVLKFAPLSTEVARQIQTDETVKNFIPENEEAMEDLSLMPNEVFDAEYEESEAQEEK